MPILLFQPREATDVALGVRLLEGDPCLLQPALQVDEPAGGQDVFHAGSPVAFTMLARVLAQVAQGPSPGHGPTDGWGLPGQDPEQAGLPGSIPADYADLVPRPKGE